MWVVPLRPLPTMKTGSRTFIFRNAGKKTWSRARPTKLAKLNAVSPKKTP
ncbi:MAG: hypothetical protein IPK00_04760 [Deltaproteobacteria bacterium]|nr:hypothetical protein [Deltaproteobacteria bacterium]